MQKLPLHKLYSNIKGRIYHHTRSIIGFQDTQLYKGNDIAVVKL